ncbi:MAG: class I SAM-dependent methyltransferase [Maricaulaceae bacterium]|nr:class I SAM-dependent methyltransferase [Maricaulaceae bacterium]
MTIRAASLIAASLLALAACGAPQDAPETPAPEAVDDGAGVPAPEAQETEEGPAYGSLAWAIAGEWRGDAAARDEWRNPEETLTFFGVDPSGTVIEIWPGAGWYTDILAPWLAANGGTYVGASFLADSPSEGRRRGRANFEARYSANPELYGNIVFSALEETSGPLVPAGTADAVLTFRNVHNWMMQGFAEKAFADFYDALRPGGVLGIVEHRLPDTREQDPRAASGYVQEAYVIALAEEAGFELVARSEINANPADTADHPFGVWTLPPVRRSAAPGEEPDPDFDRARYDAIGESDRMTLLFRKPGGE